MVGSVWGIPDKLPAVTEYISLDTNAKSNTLINKICSHMIFPQIGPVSNKDL